MYIHGLLMLEVHMRVLSLWLFHEMVEVLVPRETNDGPTQVMALGLLWEGVGSEHPSFTTFQGSAC